MDSPVEMKGWRAKAPVVRTGWHLTKAELEGRGQVEVESLAQSPEVEQGDLSTLVGLWTRQSEADGSRRESLTKPAGKEEQRCWQDHKKLLGTSRFSGWRWESVGTGWSQWRQGSLESGWNQQSWRSLVTGQEQWRQRSLEAGWGKCERKDSGQDREASWHGKGWELGVIQVDQPLCQNWFQRI